MSLHSFSNLAVQDITDEAAATQSGGVSFQGASGPGGTGIVSPFTANGSNPTILSDTAVGTLRTYSFTGDLSPANDQLDSFAIFNVPNTTNRYRATFYAGFTPSGPNNIGVLTLSRADQGQFKNVAAVNATSSVRIERIS